jgi:oxygen-independent coproporphyrinogen-3 oxidase
MTAGVYLHIPFCKSRCSYCDFATDVWRSSDAVERYVDVLNKDIRKRAFPSESPTPKTTENTEHTEQKKPRSADTVYFGGGTPSLLSPYQVEQILDAVSAEFCIDPTAEITMEMNPATVTPATLTGYRSLGVNRASFGVQTFNDRDLKLLARGHNADDARNTFKLLRAAGFDNISFDLIIGLPGQTLDDWQRNLDEALVMQPEHLSLYLLEIHQGTPLAEQIRSERRPMPDEELAAEMYELMQERVVAAGFAQYEISNFAKPGFESRHNTKYWRLDPVYGYGVSAHSFDGHQRYSNERDTAAYVKRIEEIGGAEVIRERIDVSSEFIFLGLRMTDGISLDEYRNRFGVDLNEKYKTELKDLGDSGLIEYSNGRLRLTPRGMLYSNDVFRAFV